MKLGLQLTEAYFPYIAYVRKSVLFKIYAANIEALNFWSFFFVGDGKLFLKFFQMLVGRAK